MKTFHKALAVAALTSAPLLAGAASAQNFNGATIQYQFRNPNLTSVGTTLTAIVGPQVEFTDPTNFYIVDLSGSTFSVTDTYGGQNIANAFNGIVLSDTTNNLAAITGVTFASGGFAGEKPTLTFDANNIYLNFANITQVTAVGTVYRYNVSFASAAVPEPAAWAMIILGMGAVGFAMRRQKVATRVSYAA